MGKQRSLFFAFSWALACAAAPGAVAVGTQPEEALAFQQAVAVLGGFAQAGEECRRMRDLPVNACVARAREGERQLHVNRNSWISTGRMRDLYVHEEDPVARTMTYAIISGQSAPGGLEVEPAVTRAGVGHELVGAQTRWSLLAVDAAEAFVRRIALEVR